ncbi:MAG: ribosome biogenesis GTPase Der [Acidimicrobiia bacterium]
MARDRTPIVAVVGRPNVGKSTLVNRVLRQRAAVVESEPGVTRDRREFQAEWAGRHFLLVDTGGWVVAPDDQLALDIGAQAEAAVKAADVVLFVVEAGTGITEDDAGVAHVLREAHREVLVVVNKVDGERQEPLVVPFWSLGLGEPIGVSSLHGRGFGDLLDRIVSELGESEAIPDEDIPSLALVGRPNVGKSTLLNRFLGEERVLVSPTPGTTRDPIDAVVDLDGTSLRVVDTAGLRRAARLEEGTEYYSVLRARQALRRADVAVLMIDANDGVTHQDQRIAEEAAGSGSGIVILLNKWDIASREAKEDTVVGVGDRFGFVSWAPVLRGSALTGARLHRLPDMLRVVLENRAWRIPTGRLNRLVRGWTDAHPPPVRKGRRPKILYAVQAGIEPPTVVLFVGGGDLGPDYLRFMEGRLRGMFPLEGTPIHMVTRRKSRVHV